jgi:hypothetical protein
MRITEAKIHQIVREELRSTQTQALLNEGIIEDYGGEIAQFVIGAAAEYGFGAVTLPAAGAGLAVGPAANTVVDAAFGARSVATIGSILSGFSSQAGEFSTLIDDIKGASAGLAKGTDAFYQNIKRIIEKLIGYTGGTASAAISQMAGKMKAIIKNIITLLIEPLTKGIKLIVPDAIIGSGISVSIVTALKQLDRKCFDVVVSAVKALPDTISKFILDPNAAPEFLEQMIPILAEFLRKFSEKIKNTSWLTTAAATLVAGPIAPAIPAIKVLGKTGGFNTMAKMLEDNKDDLVSVAKTVSSVAIPMMFGLLAAWQVIMTNDFLFDSNKETANANGNAGSDNAQAVKAEGLRRKMIQRDAGVSSHISESTLRQLIREELAMEEKIKKQKYYRNR